MAQGNKPYKTKGDAASKKARETAKGYERTQSAREGYGDSNIESKFKSKAKVAKG